MCENESNLIWSNCSPRVPEITKRNPLEIAKMIITGCSGAIPCNDSHEQLTTDFEALGETARQINELGRKINNHPLAPIVENIAEAIEGKTRSDTNV